MPEPLPRFSCPTPDPAAMLLQVLAWGDVMRLDNELLRDLMLQIEAHDDWLFHLHPTKDMTPERRSAYYHLRLLTEAGLLEEQGQPGGVFRMTLAGHDFVAHTRQPQAWLAIKTLAAKVPNAGAGLLARVAEAYVLQKARDLGLLP